jgi:hypothetical protein
MMVFHPVDSVKILLNPLVAVDEGRPRWLVRPMT